MPSPKSMSLPELKAYRKRLRDQGKTLSTSKELGKVEDLIKTKQPEKYGDETVSSAYEKLSSGVTEFGGWTEENINEITEHTGITPNLGQPSPEQAAGIGVESGIGASGLEGIDIDLSGLTPTQQSAIEARLAQPSYTDLWEQYRDELGLDEKEELLSDLNTNIFDIEEEIEAVETSFREERPKDFLMTEASRQRRESAEKLPLREQYSDLLTNRERLTGEIESTQGLLETQLDLAQADMDRISDIYSDIADYEESNQASTDFDEGSFWNTVLGGGGFGGYDGPSLEEIESTLFAEEDTVPQISTLPPTYSPAQGEGAISDDGAWIFRNGRWERR